MNDNLPAIRKPNEIKEADTDSWITVVSNVAAFAAQIADTAFVPKGLRGSAASAAAAIMYGREVGLPPMTALTQTYVIEGRPAVSAEAMRAMVYSAGHDLEVVESNVQRCVMRGRRRGAEEWAPPVIWDMAMVPAQLKGKDNWRNYPRQMLQARATAELCRLLFPDVIHGFRAVEEFDETDATGEGEVVGPSRGGNGTVQRKARKSTGTKGEAVLDGPTERPAITGPPLPGEAGYDDGASRNPTTNEAPVTGTVGEAPDPVIGEDTVGGVDSTPAPSTVTDTPREEGSASTDTTDDPPVDDAPPAERSSREPFTPPRLATKSDLRMYHAGWNVLLKALSDDAARGVRMDLTSRIIQRPVESSNDLFQHEARMVADTCARVKSLDELDAIVIAQEAEREADQS